MHDYFNTVAALDATTATSFNGAARLAEVDDPGSISTRWKGPSDSPLGLGPLLSPPEPVPFVIAGLLPCNATAFIGTGGTGKSTLLLWIGIHVILGRPIFGRKVDCPGAVLLVTAEDDRATVAGMVRNLCDAMELAPAERGAVAEGLFIEDVSGISLRFVAEGPGGVLGPTSPAFELVESYRGAGVTLIILDPTSLLGPGERFGNDGMSELMRTSRHISSELGCAVVNVHHEAKAASREGVRDQHAGRGGSAFGDNARAVLQLVPTDALLVTHEKRAWYAPTHWTREDAEAGNVLVLYLHKLSGAKRDRAPTFIRRHGWVFETAPAQASTDEDRHDQAQGVVLAYVRDLLEQVPPVRLSISQLQDEHYRKLQLSRPEARRAVDNLLAQGRLVSCPLPKGETQGRRTTYVAPVGGAPLQG